MRAKRIIKYRMAMKTLKRIALLSPFALILNFHSCQIPYTAEIEEKTGVISIEGSLVKGDTVQYVTISRSTSLHNPEFDPETGCVVSIQDDLGNVFVFQEDSMGIYSCRIPDESLYYERKYKLLITSASNEEYESSFEPILKAAPIDSVYYEADSRLNPVNDEQIEGLQFYIDLAGSDSDSRYYRWGLTETWEYHSVSIVSYLYIDWNYTKKYPEEPMFYCWKTREVPGLYSTSTADQSTNEKKQIPLHFVTSQDDRLRIKYSLLIKQYALNEGAYNYWNQSKIETLESGKIHSQQPGQIPTNICNVNNPEEAIVGYFWTSSISEKRIFVKHPGDIRISLSTCKLSVFEYGDLNNLPVYIFENPIGIPYTSTPSCMNCLLLGGTNQKPDFWE